MLGNLKDGGRGARLIPLAFHVDYFNEPWKDPHSAKIYSQRQAEYSRIYQREQKSGDPAALYFTPMLMVDGREPMLGTDPSKSRAALRRALTEKPKASIIARLADESREARSRTLTVEVKSLSPRLNRRALILAVAVWEDPVRTEVGSGENQGKTLVDRYAVRSFVYRSLTLEPSRTRMLSFPVELGEDWNSSRCGVAVFLQDEETGKVYQAESLRWNGKSSRASAAR
ncbi:MAG: hypothetical protein NVSMB9_19340 [Isosphaeraceae bacterium]